MGWLRVIWYVLTLRCEEADRVRSVARGGERLRAGARFGAWAHTSLCSNCRKARRRLRELDRLVDDLRGDPDASFEGAHAGAMPADARERIRKSLQKTPENDR